MSPHSRRQVLQNLSALAVGTALTSGVSGSPGGRSDSEAVVWHTAFGDGDYQCHTVVDTPDGVLLVGRTGGDRSATPWLAEIGPDGDPTWTTTFDTAGYTRAVDAVADADGVTVLVTTDEQPAIRLLGLDADGDEQWRRSLEGPEDMADEDGERSFATNTYKDNAHVLYSADDGYLIGGFHGPGAGRVANATPDAWLRAVDTQGDTRWNRLYDGTSVSNVSAFGDGYLLAGGADDDAWLQMIDADGEPRWRHTYGGVGSEIATVAIPTAKGILYGGRSHSMADRQTRAILVRTTAGGEFVWRRSHDPLHVTDLLPFGDGFVLTGEPPNPDRSGRNPDKPVSVVDRWGRVQQTATVSLDPGEPTGLARFGDDAVAVGGWDSDRGIWLAKLDFSLAE